MENKAPRFSIPVMEAIKRLDNMEHKYTLDKPENTVFCSTNSPEVQEFIELSSVDVETDNIDEQKTTKSKWEEI